MNYQSRIIHNFKNNNILFVKNKELIIDVPHELVKLSYSKNNFLIEYNENLICGTYITRYSKKGVEYENQKTKLIKKLSSY